MAEPISLRDLLKAMSDHFDGLATEVFQIEHAMGEETGATSGRSAQTITRLQRLDFLRQSLEDMALLMLALSRSDDAVVDPRLVDKVRLGSTKDMIAGHAGTVAFAPQEDAIGEIDMF